MLRPDYEREGVRLYCGDVLDVLPRLEAGSVHCCITSPPYWGLRDYGIEPSVWPDGSECCLGLEPTPELFVEHIVEVFGRVRRVLRDDGVLWMNMGDGYASGGGSGAQGDSGQRASRTFTADGTLKHNVGGTSPATCSACRGVARWRCRRTGGICAAPSCGRRGLATATPTAVASCPRASTAGAGSGAG